METVRYVCEPRRLMQDINLFRCIKFGEILYGSFCGKKGDGGIYRSYRFVRNLKGTVRNGKGEKH